MEQRIVFHADFDYFYAQCEEIRDPGIRSSPVCVCVYSGRGGDSGAVATANYAAREYGAKSGIPISHAKAKLSGRKDAVFLPVDFDYYGEMSANAMRIISSFADVFEYVGRDEAYLDVTARCGGDFGRAAHLAQQLKNSVRRGTGLGCSVGVSFNKLLAKMASSHQKPDGLTIVPPGQSDAFLDGMGIRSIHGIGNKTEARLTEMGLTTLGDVRGLDVFELVREFGRKAGTYIYNAVRGADHEPVRERAPSAQYGKLVTLGRDSSEYGYLAGRLAELCGGVGEMLAENAKMFRTVGVQLIDTSLSSKTKSRTLKAPTASTDALRKASSQLLKEALAGQERAVRRLGVRVSELSDVRGQSEITSYF